jgi:acetyl esterase
MVAAVSLLAQKRKRPKINFQLMFYPVTDYAFDDGSYTEFAMGRG